MTVAELITELQKWPSNARVHIDVCAADQVASKPKHEWENPDGVYVDEDFIFESGWEGDRVVRGIEGVRHQQGFFAVAIDAQSLEDTENEEANFIEIDDEILPSGS